MQVIGQLEDPADLHPEETLVPIEQEAWVGPKSYTGRFGEEQIPCPYCKSNPMKSGPYPTHHTDCSIPTRMRRTLKLM